MNSAITRAGQPGSADLEVGGQKNKQKTNHQLTTSTTTAECHMSSMVATRNHHCRHTLLLPKGHNCFLMVMHMSKVLGVGLIFIYKNIKYTI